MMIDPRAGGKIPHYRRCGWAVFRQAVAPVHLPELLHDVWGSPSRRVTVGDQSEHWTEYDIAAETALGEYLGGAALLHLAETAAGFRLQRGPTVWAQSYSAGERISWHCDATGAIQFLLCLQAPDAARGGAFCMRIGGREIRLELASGDAVLFKATDIPHSTTRLMSDGGFECLPRVTAVARFFEDAGI